MSSTEVDATGVTPYSDMSGVLDPGERIEFAKGLRDLADWVDSSDAPIHRYAANFIELTMFGDWWSESDRALLQDDPARLRRSIGGLTEKVYSGESFELIRRLSGGLRVRYTLDRASVCTPKVVGTKTVKLPNSYTDDDRARELKAELESLRRTEQRDVIEYDCTTSILDDEAAV